MKKILMIEDDAGLIRVIGDRLRAEGYEVESESDGILGLNKAIENNYDLLLVDLMLPGAGGFDIIRELRAKGHSVPIIIISAKFQLSDKVSGLRLGADDYMVKPFDFEEMLARIEANIRRRESLDESLINRSGEDWMKPGEPDFSFGDFVLDYNKCELRSNSEQIMLSNIEYRLLVYLVVHRDRVVNNEELLQKVWNYDDTISTRTLYVHIAWLRKKICGSDDSSEYIRTVRGMGYRFIY